MSVGTESKVKLREALEKARDSLPKMDSESHKGQAGRICVVGGSSEYSGAPYFSAMSTLRAGADLAFVVTEATAAAAIKPNSPDVIVYPSFDPIFENPSPVLSKAHALVVGPGIGRGEQAGKAVRAALLHSDATEIPIVADADALWFLSKDKNLRDEVASVKRSAPLVLTPNVPEMQRLCDGIGDSNPETLASYFGPTTVVLAKGSTDEVVTPAGRISVNTDGSLKRVGGQGDILSGLVGMCLAWDHIKNSSADDTSEKSNKTSNCALRALSAVAAASALNRECSRRAFNKHKRALLSSDILEFIGFAINDLENRCLIDEIASEK